MTRFEIDASCAAHYPAQDAGGREHLEPWVPSDELEWFNDHLVGEIVVTEAFTGPRYAGSTNPRTNLPSTS